MDRKAALKDPLLRRFQMRYLPRIRKAFAPEEVWAFGSRVRGDAMEESDLDVLIVSRKFEGIPWPNRSAVVFLAARIRDSLEILCYTPSEFQEKRQEIGIVQAAVEEGRRLFPKKNNGPR